MEIYEEKIRTDYEPIRKTGSRLGFEKGRVGRVKISPVELASFKLYKALEKYSEYFTKEARSQIQEEYKDFENLETMNPEFFAAVLAFLKDHPNYKPEDFKDEIILEYLSRFLPPSTSTDRERIIIRLKFDFLKYIIAIVNFKKEKEEEFETYQGEQEEEEYDEDQYEDEDYEYSE